MRTLLTTAAVVALTIALVSGCSNDESPDFDVSDAQAFATAQRVCSTAPPEQLAEQLGVLNSPTDVARAYSETVAAEDRENAFAGCLAGLASRPGGQLGTAPRPPG
ncbi:MAG: hypothetical protein JNK12_06775 [Acidimicrobiales bacterium]|nr:hypothetical protein [Acidimicrobiales bacterium]